MSESKQIPQGEKIPCGVCGGVVRVEKAQVEALVALEARLGHLPSDEELSAAAMCGRCAFDYRGKSSEYRTFSLAGSKMRAAELAEVRRKIAERRSFFPTTKRFSARKPTSKAS